MTNNIADPNSRIEPGKLFVGGLSWDTTRDGLMVYFSRWGELDPDGCSVMKDPSGRPRGFGFVQYRDPACVQSVLNGGPHVLDNKTIDPKQATAKGCTPPTGTDSKTTSRATKVFVGGIPANTVEEDMRSVFCQYGEVVEVDLKYDKNTGRMRGFGFVAFEDEEVAKKLCDTHHVVVKEKQVEIKKAEPRYATASAISAPQMQPSPFYGHGMPQANQYTYGAATYAREYTLPPYPYNQQSAQQQYTAAQASGGGYGYGGAYNHTAGTYGQLQQGYNYRYPPGATPQQQQMTGYGQESNSYPTGASSYAGGDYTNTGYPYSDTSTSYQPYPDQTSGVATATGYPRAATTQPRGAAAGAAYNSFGGAR